jgi:GNAT superfamily N-acetyltransferase
MDIKEYDDVDPLGVLALNLSSLGYPLTSETAALIRKLDQRPFPFLAVYAVVDEIVAGQVGVFRLPVMTTEGPSEMGGVWAVSTQPAYGRRGIATRLMEVAHERMRAAGLRFSTLGTTRSLAAHRMYRKMGYVDAHIATVTVAETKDIFIKSSVKAKKAEYGDLQRADAFYGKVAAGRLGFARRQPDFLKMLSKTGELDGRMYLLRDGGELLGYAVVKTNDKVLAIVDLLLQPGVDPVVVISALITEFDVPYVRVRIEDPAAGKRLVQAGFPTPLPEYGSFMMKALHVADDISDAARLLGIGTGRFMISVFDTT